MADPLIPPAQRMPRRFALRHAAAVLIVAGAVLVMLLTSGQMADLRVALPLLSRGLNWLDTLPVALDTYHVAFFALVALTLRLLLPRVRGWWLLLGLCGLALSTELLQFGTIGRTPLLVDARDDVVGSVVGLLLGSLPLWCAGRAKGLLRLSGILVLAGIALLPLQQWPVASAFGFPLLPSDAMFVLALATRGFALGTGNADIRITGFHGWMAAYVLAALLAVMVLPLPSASPSMGKWVGVVYLALLAALACDLAARPGAAGRIAVTWVAAASAVSMLSIIAVAGFCADRDAAWLQPLLNYHGSLPPGDYPRVRASFNYASMFANFLLVGVCLLLGLRMQRCIAPGLFVAVLLVIVIGALPALTPGLGGIPLALGLAAWWSWKRDAPMRARAALVAGVVPAIGMLLIASRSMLSPLETPSQRWLIWSEALTTFGAHPWRGVGLGQEVVGVRYLDPSGGHQFLTDAHNIWLSVAGQGGVPMLLAFVGMSAWVGLRGLRAARAGNALAASALLALGVAVFYDGLTGSFEDARHLWVLLGMLAGMPSLASSAEQHEHRPHAKPGS